MSETVDSPKTYLLIFAALMLLTGITVGAAFIDFGRANVLIALIIAGFKASLVIWFFMHVRHQGGLGKVFVFAGFIWLFILMLFTLADYETRSWDRYPENKSWITQSPQHYAERQSPRFEHEPHENNAHAASENNPH